MNSTLLAIVLGTALVAVVTYVLRRLRLWGRSSTDLDAGTISQSWLTQHRAGKQEDRFS